MSVLQDHAHAKVTRLINDIRIRKNKRMQKLTSVVSVMVLLFLWSCATSNHGTFVASTYTVPSDQTSCKPAGKVSGESTQIWVLYIFPIGDSPSTNSAILDAKSQIKGTAFLTDLSIDDKTYWKFGYSEQAVNVEATAYK